MIKTCNFIHVYQIIDLTSLLCDDAYEEKKIPFAMPKVFSTASLSPAAFTASSSTQRHRYHHHASTTTSSSSRFTFKSFFNRPKTVERYKSYFCDEKKLNNAASRIRLEIPRASSSNDANGESEEGENEKEASDTESFRPATDIGTGENNASSAGAFKTAITEDPNFLRGLESSSSTSSTSSTSSSTSSSSQSRSQSQSPLSSVALSIPDEQAQKETVRSFLYPGEEELPDDVEMSIWEHLEELRDRALISSGAVAAGILLCFCFAKDLVIFLEKPVSDMGVRFLQLGPGEYFFTTVKVAGYTGILLAAPVVLYEIIAYVLPGLTKNERKVLGPIVLGSSVLFYIGIYFAYLILTPAALKFFVGYADGAVESLWSIDQYFEFVLVLLFSTGLSFQVPVIQLLLGQTGIVSSKQMLSAWKFVIVGSVVAAAVLTPSTDPFTQMLLAIPLMSLYFGGAALVGVVEREREIESSS